MKERIVVMVRDPYWLHAYWEVKRQSVERVQAAMSQDWHTARPYLRLLEVSDGGNSSAIGARDPRHRSPRRREQLVRPRRQFARQLPPGIGLHGQHRPLLCRWCAATSSPRPSRARSDAIDENWTDVAENFDKIYAMSGGYSPDNNSLELQELFEERLRRPMGSPMVTRYGSGMEALFSPSQDFKFEVDAEMIVYGVTNPNYARQSARRAGAHSPRRHVHGADEPAQPTAGDSRRGQRRQRRRAADDRAGRRAQHQGDGTGGARSQRIAFAACLFTRHANPARCACAALRLCSPRDLRVG